jgi:hypothetical protein
LSIVPFVANPRESVPTSPVSLTHGRAGLSPARHGTQVVSGESGVARSYAKGVMNRVTTPAAVTPRYWFIRVAIFQCFVAVVLMCAVGGCANWHSDADLSKVTRGLPPPKKPPGGAVLDIAFVSIRPSAVASTSAPTRTPRANRSGAQEGDEVPETDSSPDADDSVDPMSVSGEPIDIWRLLDETVVVPEVRGSLRRNGIRFGKVQNVGDFHQQLQAIRRTPSPTSEVLEIADVQSDLSHQARRITCRIGKRYELPVRQPATQDQVVLVARGDATVGQTLSNAQPLFALRASTADSRSVTLLLRPEIQHGEMRQTWVGSDAALRIENRRDAWVLDDLTTEITLEKGGILVAGGIDPTFGLGKHMFTGTTAEGDTDQVLMVIRVVELPELIAP